MRKGGGREGGREGITKRCMLVEGKKELSICQSFILCMDLGGGGMLVGGASPGRMLVGGASLGREEHIISFTTDGKCQQTDGPRLFKEKNEKVPTYYQHIV